MKSILSVIIGGLIGACLGVTGFLIVKMYSQESELYFVVGMIAGGIASSLGTLIDQRLNINGNNRQQN